MTGGRPAPRRNGVENAPQQQHRVMDRNETQIERRRQRTRNLLQASIHLLTGLAVWCALSVHLGCPCNYLFWGDSICGVIDLGKSAACAANVLVGPIIIVLNLLKNRTRETALLLAVWLALIGYVYVTAPQRCGTPRNFGESLTFRERPVSICLLDMPSRPPLELSTWP